MIDTPETPSAPADPQPRRQRLFGYVLLAAVLATAAFPPLDAGFLAWIALVPLFFALPKASRPRAAFGLAYVFGMLHWGATIYWIGTTVSAYTNSPAGWVAWILLDAMKSLWFGLFGLLAWTISRRASGQVRALASAAAWVIVEWLRGQTRVAMPWSLIGYTQYAYLPVIQVADLAGVYGVSFLIAWSSSAIAEAWRSWRSEKRRRACLLLVPPACAVCASLVYGFIALNRSYAGRTVRIALVQPNLGSGWRERKSAEQEFAIYRRLGVEAAAQSPELMVWPESTAENVIHDPPTRSFFSRIAQTSRAYQMLGTGYSDDLRRIYNSAAIFGPDGSLVDRYDKNWLVPMGEWIPARDWWPLQHVFRYPDVLTPGSSDKVITAGAARICGLICYESVFPVIERTRVLAGANLLVCITNDSWAGRSPELQQHVAMSAFRAVETRRCLAASATTGVTCVIAPTGSIDAIPPYKEAVLVRDVPLVSGLTFYARLGDWLVAGSALLLAVTLWARRTKDRTQARS